MSMYVTGCILDVLRWLPVRQRAEYRVASLVWRGQFGIAPIYLIVSIFVGYCEWLLPTLCGKGVLSVPFARTTLMQARAFCVNGPSVWNGLPLEWRLLSRTLSDTFYHRLKTVDFECAEVGRERL